MKYLVYLVLYQTLITVVENQLVFSEGNQILYKIDIILYNRVLKVMLGWPIHIVLFTEFGKLYLNYWLKTY